MKTHPVGFGLLLLLCAGGVFAQPKPEAAHATLEAGPAQRGLSLYQLDVSFVDQDGQAARLDVFRGQPVLVSMFYGNCPYACPLLFSRLKRLEAALTPEARAQLRVVLVSLDPEHDTPASLQQLARAHGLDTTRWRLLRTEEASVREVAAVLGIKYRPLRDGQMNHSTVITLLDRQGAIDMRVDGADRDTAELVARMNALSQGTSR
jgi:protein SCO1/2